MAHSSPSTEHYPFRTVSEPANDDQPTASHAFAKESITAEPGASEEQGACQVEHGHVEVKNLGWNEDVKNAPVPLVGGLKNEEIWTLIRRFNKQVFHVKSIETPPLADLDMNIADDEDFSPAKLRAQLERLYMTSVIALFGAWKHIVRLRSWREWQRTATFLSVYVMAWLLDLIIPSLFAFLMTLTLYPPARDICFPSVPPSLVDPNTGGIKKPAAGVFASEDSMTGAPEKHEGEAVEQEAHSFVNSIATLVISTSAGKHPQGDPHEDNTAPDPTEVAAQVLDARETTSSAEPTTVHDKTRKPVSETVWNKARPTMRLIADFTDTWERFANALSPTPPFPDRRPRFTLSACLVPMLIGSYFTTSYMLLKGIGFATGFGFFGDPIITPSIAMINRTYPRWEKYVELRHTILRGVPTNAQLAVTLLRIGEKNKAPLPPPPASDLPPATEPDMKSAQDAETLGVSGGEIEAAVHHDPAEEDHADNTKEKPKKARRVLNMLKSTTRGGIQTALTADKAKAKAGASHARDRLGAVTHVASNPAAGPVSFPARYKGKRGHAYITVTATTPAVSWTSDLDDVGPAWTVTIADVRELKKVGGLGWKSKIAVGWALGRPVVDGLVVKTKQGDEFHLTAITTRDEFFNRLIAMGSQMWESL